MVYDDVEAQMREDEMIALAIQRSMEEVQVGGGSASSSASENPPPPLPPLQTSMQTDGGIDPDSMAWMGGSLGASSGDTEDLSPKYRQSGEKKRREKRRGSQSFRSGREDDWGSSSGPSSSNKPSKGTKRAKREGEAEGDEDFLSQFDAHPFNSLEESTREQEEELARTNDETLRRLLGGGPSRGLRDSAIDRNSADDDLDSRPSRRFRSSTSRNVTADTRAARSASNLAADLADDSVDEEEDGDEHEQMHEESSQEESGNAENAEEEGDNDGLAPDGNAAGNNSNNDDNNDTLTIPSDAPNDSSETSPPPPLRVGGGLVQSSDVLISLVAWENMAQIDQDSPVITTKSDTEAQYLQSLSPSKKLKQNLKQSGFVFVEKGHRVRFAMAKTDNTMRDLFKLYGEVTGLDVKDLSFAHASELPLDNTLEQCCLMKDDVVFVSTRKDQSLDTEEAAFVEKSDLTYFQQLRSLMPDIHPGANVVFDCAGKSRDGQRFFSTLVKGHSAVISSRCKWLGEKIRDARRVERLQGVQDGKGDVTSGSLPSTTSSSTRTSTLATSTTARTTSIASSDPRSHVSATLDNDADETDSLNEDSRGIEVPMVIMDDRNNSLPPAPLNVRVTRRRSRGVVSNIVEAPMQAGPEGHEIETSSPIVEVNTPTPPLPPKKMLKISIPNHNPEAFKILLEFLYTNRCPTLGEKAFVSTSVLQGEPDLTEEELHQLLQGGNGPISVEDENGMPLFPADILADNRKTIWHEQGVKLIKSVAPFTRWPNGGKPTVTMDDVLSTLRLAEEAKVQKLSRMCQVAASELLGGNNICNVIVECGSYMEKGKDMKILKAAAMTFILEDRNRSRSLLKNHTFLRTIEEHRDFMVPMLLDGIESTLPHVLRRSKPLCTVYTSIQEQDREDKRLRDDELKAELKRRDPQKFIPPYQPVTTETMLEGWYAGMHMVEDDDDMAEDSEDY